MSMNITKPQHIRTYALASVRSLRPFHTWTQVSQEFLDHVEAATRQAIVSRIKINPSKGRTLR